MSFYQTLLSVVVEHSYNQSGVCPCLQFNPTDKTRAVLRKAGLLCKETTSGIQIVYDQSRLEALQLYAQDSQEPLSFDFKVYSRDPDFRSYSEPFSATQDGILYFDNRSAGAPGKQALTAAEVVSVKDFKSAGASEFADLLSQRNYLLPPEFILRIFADSTRGALLPQWLLPEPTVYSMHFNSRQRYWKYYLLGKMVANNKAKTGYSVVDPDNQVEFEATGEEMLSDQIIAYTFRSKQQIPLNERYSFRFQLKQTAQGRETVVMPRLPVASVRQVGMEAVAEQQTMVSEIYINS